DNEDERCQAEGVDRGQAKRVVDRGADVPVRSREERRGTEHALQPGFAAPPPWHGADSIPLSGGVPGFEERGAGNSPKRVSGGRERRWLRIGAVLISPTFSHAR